MTAIQHLRAALLLARKDLADARESAECQGDYLSEEVTENAIATAMDNIIRFNWPYVDESVPDYPSYADAFPDPWAGDYAAIVNGEI